jgi:hypothetical protein
MMLVVQNHPKMPKMSGVAKDRMWAQFLEKGTSHSAMAMTLPYILNRCVEEKVPFTLKGDPAAGYWIEPMKKPTIKEEPDHDA